MSAPTQPSLKTRIEKLLAEYGPVFMVIYFSIFGLVLAGFAIAIGMGMQVESASGKAGTLGAAWLATKVTQPLRIAASAALTPLIGKRWMRRRAAATTDVELPRDDASGSAPGR